MGEVPPTTEIQNPSVTSGVMKVAGHGKLLILPGEWLVFTSSGPRKEKDLRCSKVHSDVDLGGMSLQMMSY